jgi:hypothetical protein
MIKTVYDIADFAEMADFTQDVYYTWETENVSKMEFPVVELRKQVFGLSHAGDLIVYDSYTRISMLALLAGGPRVGDPHKLMTDVIDEAISEFEVVVESMAKDHNCRAIPGSLALSPSPSGVVSSAIIDTLSEQLDALELRLRRLEAGGNYDD